VESAVHAFRLQGRGCGVEGVGQGLTFFRVGEITVAGDDKIFAADGLMELDGFRQLISPERRGLDVGAGNFEAQAVEAPS
jgi:hypothetical protein